MHTTFLLFDDIHACQTLHIYGCGGLPLSGKVYEERSFQENSGNWMIGKIYER